MRVVHNNVALHILVAVIALLPIVLVIAGVDSAAADNWRPALHVEVDRDARIYLEGARVDTLVVYRGQVIFWNKRDKDGPDLTVLFGRKLFHPRHWMRVKITEEGRPRYVRVDDRARMREYEGTPEKGFVAAKTGLPQLRLRVIPPPEN
jgi:hypothetical protein